MERKPTYEELEKKVEELEKLIKEILNTRSDIPIILCTGFSEK